jgi:hypothetical protein
VPSLGPQNTPSLSTSADLVGVNRRATVYFKQFLDILWLRTGGFGDVNDIVDGLPTDGDIITASLPQTALSISTDMGVTWTPVGSAGTYVVSLTASFTNLTLATVTTQVITGTRTDATGFWTLIAGAHTGEPVTVEAFIGVGTQSALAIITHTATGKKATLAFVSAIDTSALGGAVGGSGYSK